MSKIIMHIDLNAFFATAEVIKNPNYAGKPLIVAGKTKRGIVSTASYEARKYGIHSAMPTYQALRLCPNLIVCASDFDYYSRLSSQFFDFVKQYSPIIEIASIDECYVDMTDVLKEYKNVVGYLSDLQKSLYEQTKLKCSIGIGPTKFLAKMASDMKKPMGITILRKRDLKTKLYPLPISDMYGIGKKTAPRLIKLGINTIGDFANSQSPEVQKLLGSQYFTLKEWVNGKGNDVVDNSPYDLKSISASSTFDDDTNNYDEIRDMIYELSKEVSERAKKEKKLGQTIQLMIKDSNFMTHTRSVTLNKPINDLPSIFSNVMKLFDQYYNNEMIRLVGVGLQGLLIHDSAIIQMTLFDYESHEEEAKTQLLMNEINRKFDKPLLKKASKVLKENK